MTDSPYRPSPPLLEPDANDSIWPLTMDDHGSSARRGLRRKRWLALLLGAVLLAGLVTMVLRGHGEGTAAPLSEPIVRRVLRVDVTASGNLEALTTVDVGAEVSGRIIQLDANENDFVRRGQTLAKIAPQDLELAVDQALAELHLNRAAVLETNATLNEADLAFKRSSKLREPGLVGEQALEGARANRQRAAAAVAAASAKVQLAKAALALARSRLAKTTISSPIDGVVLTRFVEPGQTITAGFQTPQLFKLAEDLAKLRLEVAIAEADIARVRIGQVATFTAEAFQDRSFSSHVTSLANEATVKQGVVSFRAVLQVDNTERLLRPGMSCTVKIRTLEREGALAVPNAALRYGATQAATDGDSRRLVWVVEPERPRRIEVRLGERDGSFTELLEPPLPAGTRVLVASDTGE